MKHIALIAAALVTASPAWSLSCLRPDPAETFQRANAAPETYVVLRGSFRFDEGLMPEFDGVSQPESIAPVPARFSGHALRPEGFVIPYETELFLQPECAGPWCGSMLPTEDAVAFARDNGEGVYVVDLGPCGGTVFEATPEVVATITECMAGGACARAD